MQRNVIEYGETSLVSDIIRSAELRDSGLLKKLLPKEIYSHPKDKQSSFMAVLDAITSLARVSNEAAINFLLSNYTWFSNPDYIADCRFEMLLAKVKGLTLGMHHSALVNIILIYSHEDHQKKIFTAAIEGYTLNKYFQVDQPNDKNLIYILSFFKNSNTCEIFYKTFKAIIGCNNDFASLFKQSRSILKNYAFQEQSKQLARLVNSNSCTYQTAFKMQHIIDKYRIQETEVKYWPTLFILFYEFNPVNIKNDNSQHQLVLPRELVIYIATFVAPIDYQHLTHLYVRMRLLANPKDMILAKDRKTILSQLAISDPKTHATELAIEKQYTYQPDYSNYKTINPSLFFAQLSEAVRDVADFILSCLNSCKSTKVTEYRNQSFK